VGGLDACEFVEDIAANYTRRAELLLTQLYTHKPGSTGYSRQCTACTVSAVEPIHERLQPAVCTAECRLQCWRRVINASLLAPELAATTHTDTHSTICTVHVRKQVQVQY